MECANARSGPEFGLQTALESCTRSRRVYEHSLAVVVKPDTWTPIRYQIGVVEQSTHHVDVLWYSS